MARHTGSKHSGSKHSGSRHSGLRSRSTPQIPERRDALRTFAAGLGAGALIGSGSGLLAMAKPLAAAPATHATRARIVIAGGGAAGLSAAARLSARLDGARITMVEPSARHVYQPGLTMVGCGHWRPDSVISSTARFLPQGVAWKQDRIATFDADNNRLVTRDGSVLDYDFLIVATGCSLHYEGIEGLDSGALGRDGVVSVYAGPEAARATWAAMSAFAETGGTALFGRPVTDIKCAGAPLKMTMLTDDRLRRQNTRSRAEIVYCAHGESLFGVPVVADVVETLFRERDIAVLRAHDLIAVDRGARQATYQVGERRVTMAYDLLHVVPPMRAAEPVRDSSLAWQDGPFRGWLEVDPVTLRHRRYPNVFGIGDVNGVPKGKTAASVKWQTPVATENLIATIAGHDMPGAYDGYTSCPLITGIGRAMLIEFDYHDRLIPSFPFIDPLTPSWSGWLMKDIFLQPTYNAMLRGKL